AQLPLGADGQQPRPHLRHGQGAGRALPLQLRLRPNLSRCKIQGMAEAGNVNGDGLELDVLAVFSHPDDAELTAAGTLLKMESLGYRTGVLDMTRGEMGTSGSPEARADEAREAARIMGLDVRLNLEQPDGHVWVTEEARTALVRVVRAYKPKVILTAHWDDPHPDHANTARIVREAARLASMRRYDEEAGQGAVPVPALANSAYWHLVLPSFVL